MCRGVGPSGLPIPKSMMSSPRRRAAILSSEVMLKTYGGSRLTRPNSVGNADDKGHLETLAPGTVQATRRVLPDEYVQTVGNEAAFIMLQIPGLCRNAQFEMKFH